MAVLRLLAVYFGAAGGTLLLARRFVSPIRWTAAAFLLLGPFLLMGRALGTAGVYAPLDIAYNDYPLAALRETSGVGPGHNPTLSDVAYQEIPWRKAVREAIKAGRIPLWNRFLLAGEPLLATQQPQLFHPTTWAGLLLPLSSAWTFEMAFRCFLALLSAYLYLREIGCAGLPSFLGASGWGFCDYLVFYAGYPLSTAAAPFPLLLLGLRRLARDADRRALAVTVGALLLITTAGHPETLLHAVAAGGVFFLFDLAAARRERRPASLRLAAAAGALTLGLSAVFLLPFLDAARWTAEFHARRTWFADARRSEPIGLALERSSIDLVPYSFGELGRGRFDPNIIEPASYAGSLLLPLAVLGLASRRREKWPLALTGAVGLAAWARLPGFADALAKVPGFDMALNDRMAMFAAFATAGLAALGADLLEQEPKRARAFGIAAAAVALALVLLNLRLRPRLEAIGMTAAQLRDHALVQLVPLAAGAILLAAPGIRRRGRLVSAFLLVILLGQRRLEAGSVYPTYPARAFYPPIPLFDRIPRGAPWRFAAVGYALVPNASTLYELEDVRGYEAMTFAPLVQTFPLWCVPQPVWYNRVDDPTRPFLSFLNVRYVFVPPGGGIPAGWRTLAEDASGQVAENPGVLPRAFVPRRIVKDREPWRQMEHLKAIRDFADVGVVEGPDEPLSKNGEASVEIRAYSPERIELEIDAKEESLVGTSITRWPGWRLTVDGRKEPLLVYNWAFLGFEVPPGRHRAVLRYSPGSFRLGAAVSGVSLLAAAAVFGRRRRGSSATERARSAATGASVRAADHSIHSDGSATGSR
jgi:hypothetical protein